MQAAAFSGAVLLACAGDGCGGIGAGGTGPIQEGQADSSLPSSSSGSSRGAGSSSSGAFGDDGFGAGSDDASDDGATGSDAASDDAGDDAADGAAGPDASASDDASDDGSPIVPDEASTRDASSLDGATFDAGTDGGAEAQADAGVEAGLPEASSDAGFDATVGPSDAGPDAHASDASPADASSDAASTDGATAHPDAGGDAGAKCDLAASWGLKLTVDVSWPSTGLVNAGGVDNGYPVSQVQIWALLSPIGTPTTTSIPAKILPCNIELPDFGSIIGETYGASFPTTLFDHEPPYLTAVSTTLTLGALSAPTSFSLPGETDLIGMSAPATGTWPAASGVTEVDMDIDGEPGVTALSKTPPTYSYVPTTIIPSLPDFSLVRADKLYMAIRFITTSLSGAMPTCTSASGATNSVVVHDMDSHVLGCHVYGDVDGSAGDCTAGQAGFVDDNRPVFTIDSASFTAAVVPTATCAEVRATLP